MEAATLSSPQRLNLDPVAPVQKSLSLPSYAKAGGEGIDHRLIFAALEQREKVRRKSKIFAREKSARQNIFCLPIPTGNRCRETSFSSDTSCSSLEYQKPKVRKEANKKSEQPKNCRLDEPPCVTPQSAASYSNYCNVGGIAERSPVNSTRPLERPANETNSSFFSAPRTVIIEQRSPANTMSKGLDVALRKSNNKSPSGGSLRPYGHSSDSMDRSSRSSNDSLTRKERLVAIKAKVEAEREKFGGDSSSDEGNRNAIARFNSDGVIHRTVREVKSRSYRLEKRLRRRSQDEYGLRKAIRKSRNLSLCLSPGEDGVYLNLFSKEERHQVAEIKTDFCPSPSSFLEVAKRNYFSDFPGKESAAKNVLNRVRQIEEEEERRRKHSAEKGCASSRQSPQHHPSNNSSPFSSQRRNADSSAFDRASSCGDALKCASPVVRAPTPPPRSPKSMSFLNKAFIQQQHAYLSYDSRSLERKVSCKPSNVPTSRPGDVGSKPTSPAVSTQALDDLVDKRQLMRARRKTCSFVDCGNSFSFKELNLKCDVTDPNTACSAQCSPKSPRVKGCVSSTPSSPLSEDPKKWLWKNKWEEAEKRQEYIFNSLESRRNVQVKPSVFKPIDSPTRSTCLCYVLSGNESSCNCNGKSKNVSESPTASYKLRCSSNGSNLNDLGVKDSPTRLYKSDANIDPTDSFKSNPESLATRQKAKCPDKTDNLIASANLDTAMKELESIYHSLKMTSEALSETNVKLNDLNSETPKNTTANSREFSSSLLQSVPRKNNTFEPEKKVYNIEPYPVNNYNDSHKYSSYSYKDNMCAKTSESERIAIDELFNDLTRQLDIEQKQFKDSHRSFQCNKWENKPLTPQKSSVSSDKKYNDSHASFQNGWQEQKRVTPAEFKTSIEQQNCNDSRKSSQDENQEQKRMTPLESIISIRKELCDLQKGSHEPNESYSVTPKDNRSSGLHENRKLHAVRSLSESISFLMGSSDGSPPVLRKSASGQHRYASRDQDLAKPIQPVPMDPPTVHLMNQQALPKRSFISERLSSAAGEEIRQIRVSMDPSSSGPKPTVRQGFPEYQRLSTAVAKQQTSSALSASAAKQQTSFAQNEARSTPVPRSTVDVLDEKGLEKLLSTLLSDVPDSRQSSRRLTGDSLSSTPPPTSGEMRVLQHLDLLRLKPIPS